MIQDFIAPSTSPMPQNLLEKKGEFVSKDHVRTMLPTEFKHVVYFSDGNLGFFSNAEKNCLLQIVNFASKPAVDAVYILNEVKVIRCFALKGPRKQIVCLIENNNEQSLVLYVEQENRLHQRKKVRLISQIPDIHIAIREYQTEVQILLTQKISQCLYSSHVFDSDLNQLSQTYMPSSSPVKSLNVMSDGQVFVESDQLKKWQLDTNRFEELDTNAIGKNSGVPILCSDGKWIFAIPTDYSETMGSYRAATWHICELKDNRFVSTDARHSKTLRGEVRLLPGLTTGCDYFLAWDKRTGNCNLIKREGNSITAPLKDCWLGNNSVLIVLGNKNIFAFHLERMGYFSRFQLQNFLNLDNNKSNRLNPQKPNVHGFFSAPQEPLGNNFSKQLAAVKMDLSNLDRQCQYSQCVSSFRDNKLALVEVKTDGTEIMRVLNMQDKKAQLSQSYSLGRRKVKAIVELNQPTHKILFVVQDDLSDPHSDKLYLMVDHSEDIYAREKTKIFSEAVTSGVILPFVEQKRLSVSEINVKQDAKEDHIVVSLSRKHNREEKFTQCILDSRLNEVKANSTLDLLTPYDKYQSEGRRWFALAKDGRELHCLSGLNGLDGGEDYIFIIYRELHEWILMCKISGSDKYICKMQGEININQKDMICPAQNGDIYFINTTPPLEIQHLPLREFILEPLMKHYNSLGIIPEMGKIINSYVCR